MASTSFCFLRAVVYAPRCVPDQKPAPQAKAWTSTWASCTGRLGCVSVCPLYSVLGLVACQDLPLALLQSRGPQEHKLPWPLETGIKGCPLGGSCKSQGPGVYKSSLPGDTRPLEHGSGRGRGWRSQEGGRAEGEETSLDLNTKTKTFKVPTNGRSCGRCVLRGKKKKGCLQVVWRWRKKEKKTWNLLKKLIN